MLETVIIQPALGKIMDLVSENKDSCGIAEARGKV